MRTQTVRRKSTYPVIIPEAYIIEQLEQKSQENKWIEYQNSREQPAPMPYWPEKKEEKACTGLIIIDL